MTGYARQAAVRAAPPLSDSPEAPAAADYRTALSLVERLHRQLLDVIKDDLERAGHDDLTPVQALLLYNIGDAEWSAGELKSRGCYLGSNVSYNLKKLQELAYIETAKSANDRRQIRIRLTAAGRALRDQMSGTFSRHARTVTPVGGIEVADLAAANKTLTRLERFWADQVRFRL